MKASALKKELHLAIDRIDDEHLLEAVYVILNKATNDYTLTVEQEKELYKRLEEHEKGEVKYIPSKKVLKEIRQKFKK
jgi:CMP-N-acetylneuraminic acid synthetase